MLEADALIMGAPGRQGGMSSEMRFFLDSLGPLQQQFLSGNSYGALKVTPITLWAMPGMALVLFLNSIQVPSLARGSGPRASADGDFEVEALAVWNPPCRKERIEA